MKWRLKVTQLSDGPLSISQEAFSFIFPFWWQFVDTIGVLFQSVVGGKIAGTDEVLASRCWVSFTTCNVAGMVINIPFIKSAWLPDQGCLQYKKKTLMFVN